MENFNGLARGFTRSKQPEGTWEFARNILLKKGFKSITNEDGFNLILDNIPGIVIGTIITSEHKVYFSIFNGLSCIGYTSSEDDYKTYIPVLQSQYLGFKLNRPIEGVYIYNYKGELVVIFCDGVFFDSNTPKLINLFNIGIPLTGLELTNPSDLAQLQYYIQSLEGMLAINYQDNGTLDADIVYITYCYVLADGISTSEYFPIHSIAYPTINYQKLDRRNILLDFTELDPNFNQIRIGLVVNLGGSLIGYQSDIITYGGTTYNTTISSLANYSEIAVDTLVVPSSVYSRIKTMTMHNSELVIGNLVKNNGIKFQKYANMLQARLWYDVRNESKYTLPILCPDEVIALYVSLHMLDGTYSEEFHIPNHTAPSVTDLNLYDNAAFIADGLDNINAGVNYNKYHVKNSGGFIDVITNPVHITDLDQMELRWGYWRNEEQYPNNDEYNSTVDYNGNALGGTDLRNTGILYHRVPGLDALVEKFPCLVGYQDRNSQALLDNLVFFGLVPAFAINIDNFDTIVPPEILAQIQGFKLSVVKRKRGDTLVEDIHFAKQSWVVEQQTVDGDKDFEVTAMNKMEINGADDIAYNVAQFGTSNINSNNLHIYKPNLSAKIIKANYGIYSTYPTYTTPTAIPYEDFDFSKPEKVGNLGGANYFFGDPFSKPNYIKLLEDQKYAKFVDVEYIPGNNSGFNTLFVDEFIRLKAHNTKQLPNVTGSTVLPNRWNPLMITNLDSVAFNEKMIDVFTYSGHLREYIKKDYEKEDCFLFHICNTVLNLTKNVYTGFNPKEFITIGRTTLTDTQFKFKEGGDTFINNTFNGYATIANGTNILGALTYRHKAIKGMFSIFNLSEVYKIYDRDTYVDYELFGGGNRVADLITYNYDLNIFNKEQLRSLNDLIVGIAFNINTPFVDYFPYRVHRSLKIGNETLTTNNLRRFLANRYKEMLNDRGEIIAVRGTNRSVYIHQRHSLFLVSIKDKLDNSATTTYVGESDIFDRLPEEILYANNKGSIGCSSQFSCYIFRGGYVSTDQVKGKIVIVTNQVDEISANNMTNWFNENWETPTPSEGYFTLNRYGRRQNIDNPFTQFGHLVGYDFKYNRLLFTKKVYKYIGEKAITDINLLIDNRIYFDGEFYYYIYDAITVNLILLDYNNTDYFKEISQTFSYDLNNKCWICEHDYFPNVYIDNSKGLYSIYNSDPDVSSQATEFKHNSLRSRSFNDNTNFISYVDLIFNSRFDLDKLYQSITWKSEVQYIDIDDKNIITRDFFKTIDAIQLYTDYQATDVKSLSTGFITRIRNTEGEWKFNDFRDIVVDRTLPLVNEEGVINQNNLNINKSWFEKSNFISNFIVTRLLIYNENNKTVYIHCVNVKSRTSDR